MEKLIEIINKIGLPFAYDHFAEGESPDPPFICYLTPNSDNFAADGQSEELKLEVLFMQKETKAVLQVTDIASHLKAVPISSIEIQQDYDYFIAQRASEALLSAGLISLVEFNKLTQLNRDTFSPMFVEIMPRIT